MPDTSPFLLSVSDCQSTRSEDLLPQLYEELRVLAESKLKREKPGHALDSTSLVHEAYLRLVRTNPETHWDSRGHFFSAVAMAMRRILIEIARHKEVRGTQCPSGDLFEDERCFDERFERLDLLALNEALSKLEAEHMLWAQIVHLRFFAGLTHEDIASVLRLSTVTIKRHWREARLWLYREMQRDN